MNGTDLISRATQSSSRLLLITSAAIILVERHGLDPTKWGLLGEQVTENVYKEAVVLTIAFLLIALLIHWSADYKFYTKWFKSNEVNMGSMYGLGMPKTTEPPIAALSRRLGQLTKDMRHLDDAHEKLEAAIEEEFPNLNNKEYYLSALDAHKAASQRADSATKALTNTVDGIDAIFDELDVRFSRVDLLAKFIVFGWYLAIPILVALLALTMIFSEFGLVSVQA